VFRSTSRTCLLLTYLGACTLEVPGAGPAQSIGPTPITGAGVGGDPTRVGPDAGEKPQGTVGAWPDADAGHVPTPQGSTPHRGDAAGGDANPAASSDAGDDTARDAAASAMTLTSSAFGAGERLPDEHSCLGAGGSPPLSWSAGPTGTQSYAVALIARTDSIVSLPSTANWVVWDVKAQALPQDLMSGAQLSSVPGARQASRVTDARGLFQAPQYQAPCSILGGQQFELVLYAVAVPVLPVDAQASSDEVVQQLESSGVLLATSRLAFTFP
jgi:phosphatidylethanolamine-binding protein (PEBP) family uncharacterized protein